MSLESKLPDLSEFKDKLRPVENALRGYKSFGKKQRRALEQIGLTVEHKAKHIAVYWPEVPGISYTFSCSPSSSTAGILQYGAMKRTLFRRE